MAESVTRQSSNHSSNEDEPGVEDTEHQNEATEQEAEALNKGTSITPARTGIIWTPKFLVTFALVLVFGLSTESILSQVWDAGYIQAIWLLIGHVAILLGLWISATIVARSSSWVRSGSVFGLAWAVFSSINLALAFFHFGLNTAMPIYLQVTYSCSLLGAYICLSIARTELGTWDMWFYRIAIIGGLVFVLIGLFVTPSQYGLPATIANNIAAFAAILSTLVWWLRPACWRTYPGLTFLLGASTALAFILTLPNVASGAVHLFLLQISYLCMILGLMRLIQGETAH